MRGVLVKSFLLFGLACGTVAEIQAEGKCKDPWFISVNENLVVSWTGKDRDAVVDVKVTSEDAHGQVDCYRKGTIRSNFSDMAIRVERPCSNTKYILECILRCGEVEGPHSQNIVVTPPAAPSSLQVSRLTNNSFSVSWKKPSGPITRNRVRLNEKVFTKDVTNSEIEQNSMFFQDLEPYTKYEISVSAGNKNHWGEWSYVLHAQTLEGVPYPPGEFRVSNVNSRNIELRWMEPQPVTGPILLYSVEWSEMPYSAVETRNTTQTFHIIRNLYPYTNYSVRIRAQTAAGLGNWTDDLVVQTGIEVPGAPSILWSQATSTTIVVKWQAPLLYRGPDLEYVIRWNLTSQFGNSNMENTKNLLQKDWYEIINVRPYSDHTVEVQAINDAGPGPWSEALKVKTEIGVPSAPRDLKVTNKTATSLVLWWSAPDPANGLLLQSSVTWKAEGERELNYESSDWIEELEVNSLIPFTEYEFQVAARTEAGWGPPSEALKARTQISAPSVPRNLSEVETTNTSITVSWEEPESPNGPLLGYGVKWVKTENETRIIHENETTTTTHRIQDLDPYSFYSIEVCAKTEAGQGPWAGPIVTQTEEGIPSAPRDVHTTHVNATSIQLGWSVPDFINGPKLIYVVHWGVEGTEASSVEATWETYSAVGLRPYTEYFFRVSARTRAGLSPSSNIVLRTDIAAPSRLRNLSVIIVDSSSILLQWLPPEHPNAHQLLYKVKWKKEQDDQEEEIHETNVTTYNIRDLDSSTSYLVQVLAVNDAGAGPWTPRLHVQTSEQEHKPKNTALIAGLVSGIVLLLILVISITAVLVIRRKKSSQTKSKNRPVIERLGPESSIQMEIMPPKPVVSLPVPNTTLTIQNFEQKLNSMMENGRMFFAQEFENLRKASPQLSCDTAKKSDNLTKNRWVKILPFDHSRVKLLPVGDEVEPDYINANYIPGDFYLLEYIATQGPLPNTVDDFWKMVWQQSVSVIVMLTQCVERAKKTCEKYWPSAGESYMYGDVQVQAVSESINPSYVIRIFLLQRGSHQRHILHLHYTNWPVSGCPRSPNDFLNFIKVVREQVPTSTSGPMLVHCSAGAGRTGSFITVDHLSQLLKHSDTFDIYNTVLELRRYRPHMVQTEDQYTFIHMCVQRLIIEKNQALEEQNGTGIYAE